MALYWILELLPLPVTSLLPLVLLPLAGVASTDEVARLYLKVKLEYNEMRNVWFKMLRGPT